MHPRLPVLPGGHADPAVGAGIPTVRGLLESALGSSGMEDATLVSLSTCDYSQAGAAARGAGGSGLESGARAALLRLDRFSVELADYVASMRRSGLTFAPEAGSPRLRAVINKNVSDDQLLALAEEAFRRGWTHIKLYFMIGLPTETAEDVDAIADLCIRTLNAGRRVRSRAQIRTGVSTFVPKPFTPFQWAAQIGIEETIARQRRLAGCCVPTGPSTSGAIRRKVLLSRVAEPRRPARFRPVAGSASAGRRLRNLGGAPEFRCLAERHQKRPGILSRKCLGNGRKTPPPLGCR